MAFSSPDIRRQNDLNSYLRVISCSLTGNSQLERLKEKASNGSYERFLRVMSKVPAVDPPECDRL